MAENQRTITRKEQREQGIQIANSLMLWQKSVEVTSLLPSKKVSTLTVKSALESPQVSFVADTFGPEYVTALFMKGLNEMCVMTNSSLSAEAIALIAQTMTADYWYLRMDEILMVLHRGLKGYYGPSNKNISAQVIFEWFNRHEQERNNHFYDQHMEKKNSFGNPSDRSPEPRLAKDVFEQMVDQKVNHRIEKYKEAAREKKTWTDKDTENAANSL